MGPSLRSNVWLTLLSEWLSRYLVRDIKHHFDFSKQMVSEVAHRCCLPGTSNFVEKERDLISHKRSIFAFICQTQYTHRHSCPQTLTVSVMQHPEWWFPRQSLAWLPLLPLENMEHQDSASIEKHTLPINQGGGRSPLWHWLLYCKGTRDSSTLRRPIKQHFLLGQPNAARPSAAASAQWCTGPLKLSDTRYSVPAGGPRVCSHLGFYSLAKF